jgi:hypothetical protein
MPGRDSPPLNMGYFFCHYSQGWQACTGNSLFAPLFTVGAVGTGTGGLPMGYLLDWYYCADVLRAVIRAERAERDRRTIMRWQRESILILKDAV